jgi:phytoene synthase
VDRDAILESLPAVQRVALAYALPASRDAWLGLLALDTRLARLVRETREPMLGQIRLAWWRERLSEPVAQHPKGEPLLALLGERADGLVSLVDGWEVMMDEPPLPRGSVSAFAAGRAEALVGLGDPANASAITRMGRRWALADLALRMSHPEECRHAADLLAAEGTEPIDLPREMRPLIVLEGLAARDLRRGGEGAGMGALLATLRLGIFGR